MTMRLPRVRFTVALTAVAIVLAAVALGAWTTDERLARLRVRARTLAAPAGRAREHAARFRLCDAPAGGYCLCCNAAGLDGTAPSGARVTAHAAAVKRFESVAARAGAMAARCSRAVYRPW